MDYKQRVDEIIPKVQGMYNHWLGNNKSVMSTTLQNGGEPMVMGAGEKRLFIRGDFKTTEDLGKMLTKISEAQKAQFPDILENVTKAMKDTKGDPTLSRQFEAIVDLQSTPIPHFNQKESEILAVFTVAHEMAHYYYSGKTTQYSEAMGQVIVAQTPIGLVEKTLNQQVNELQADIMAIKMLNHLYPKDHQDHQVMNEVFDKVKDMRLIGSVSSVAQMNQYNFYELYKDNGKLIKEISKLPPEEIYKQAEKIGIKNLKEYGALATGGFWETKLSHSDVIKAQAVRQDEFIYSGRDIMKVVMDKAGLELTDHDFDKEFKHNMTFTEKDKKHLEEIPVVMTSGGIVDGVLYKGDRVSKLDAFKEWVEDPEEKKESTVENNNTTGLKP